LKKITNLHSLLEAVKHNPERVSKILFQEGTRRPKVEEIILWARKNRIACSFLPVKRLKMIERNHQGAVGFLAAKKYTALESILESTKIPFLVLLDGIEDPQNLGAIIRTAEGAGVDGIVIPERRAAALTGTVASVAAGALEHMKVARVKNLARTMEVLKKKELWLVGAEGGEGDPWHDFDYTIPVGLVLGSEGKGLRRLVREKCDKILSIPLFGKITSLNVAAAAAIFMYEVVRQRKRIHHE
jgi:23S rRNA (guanosine2251-2'-O)-methyltransferase